MPVNMSRWGRLAAAVSLGLVTLSTADRAAAQGVVKNTFGDWQMRCETPAGAKAEQCALVQNVAAEDRPNVNLVIIVLKTADGKSRLLRVVAPLGVLLPAGRDARRHACTRIHRRRADLSPRSSAVGRCHRHVSDRRLGRAHRCGVARRPRPVCGLRTLPRSQV
jgi:hypothetical protein